MVNEFVNEFVRGEECRKEDALLGLLNLFIYEILRDSCPELGNGRFRVFYSYFWEEEYQG
jgi:hypothetical protein